MLPSSGAEAGQVISVWTGALGIRSSKHLPYVPAGHALVSATDRRNPPPFFALPALSA